MRVRSCGTATATTTATTMQTATTPRAMGIQPSLEEPEMSSVRSTWPTPTTRVSSNTVIWTRNPLNPSIAPTDSAVGAVMPWR